MVINIGPVASGAELPERASFARFLRARGPEWVGGSLGRPSYRLQIGIGSGILTIPVIMASAVFLGAPHEMLYGMAGPLIAGIINIGIGLNMRNKVLQADVPPVTLTKPARDFLAKLIRAQSGWGAIHSFHAPGTAFGQVQVGRSFRSQGLASMVNEMGAEMFDLLEQSAFQFNRIFGALTTAGKNSAATKLAPKVSSAASEAMADILHNSAMLAQYPEGGAAARMRIANQMGALRELGDHMERITTQPDSITERLVSRNQLDDVLDELRMDELARRELKIAQSELPQNINQSGS